MKGVGSYASQSKRSGKYKLKTHKATSKRFRLTGSGMLVRTKGGKSHLRRRTSIAPRRNCAKMIPVKGRSIIKRVKRLAPNMEVKDSRVRAGRIRFILRLSGVRNWSQGHPVPTPGGLQEVKEMTV